MSYSMIWRSASVLAACVTLSIHLPAQSSEAAEVKKAAAGSAPILDALNSVDEDTRKFNEHIVVLSSPFMEGRVPGSRGMEIAKEYMEFYFKQSGLEAPFDGSFRQAFPLSSTPKVIGSNAAVGNTEFRDGKDIKAHTTVAGDKAKGVLVSLGYSINNGRGGYHSFDEKTKLEGKIALILRGTPMGKSDKRWRTSRRYNVQAKVFHALRTGAAGIIVVAPSFLDGDELATMRHRRARVPILSMTRSAADAMLTSIGADQTVDSLAKMNDKAGVVTNLGNRPVEIGAEMEIAKLDAENVAGLLRGRGALANEVIVIGGHLDHLGMGYFGSRSEMRGKKVHPGADDNASGSVAVLMIAEKMAAAYQKMPADKPARSVLFMGFSAEESGLNGSRYYADNMLSGLKHVLMINFDMIGRVRDNKVSVMGTGSATGMGDWVKPLCEASPLNVRVVPSAMGGSDHLNFLRKNIPVLMGHSGQHSDYHTERDVSEKINRVGAAQTTSLFAKISLAAATWEQSFQFSNGRRR